MQSKNTCLVIAAHPDDEVLGCGGTVAGLARAGQDLYIAVLGEGVTSRYEKREEADQAEIEKLDIQCRQAAELLGAKEIFRYQLPDNRFDTVPLLKIIKIIEELIDRLRPRVVYTHHGGDLNVDHILTCRAVLTATRSVPGQPVKEIYSFEVPSSTEWAFQRFAPAFSPNVFVDITGTLDVKIEALKRYENEIRPFPHPRSPEAVKALSTRWGSLAGCPAAEAFELVRSLR